MFQVPRLMEGGPAGISVPFRPFSAIRRVRCAPRSCSSTVRCLNLKTTFHRANILK